MSTIATGNTTTNTIVVTGDTTGNLYIQTGTLTPALAMTVTNNQLVGIGTSTPGYALDVYQSGNGNLARFSNSAGIPTYIASYGSTGGIFGDSNSYTGWGYNSSSNFVVALTNNSEKMRIDSSGNLGLGVTPSAWATLKGFDISTFTASYGYTNQGGIAFNSYYDGTGWKYKQSSVAAGRYGFDTGTHYWLIAGTGTAGNAISFTQAMTLDNSGNLLVNKSTADNIYSKNIEIYGSSNAGLRFSSGSYTAGYDVLIGSSGDGYVFNRNNTNLIFGTNATERARIDNSGRLLINTTSGTTNSLFQVSSNGTKQSFQVFNNDNVQLYSLGTGTVYSNGGVLTNTNPSDQNLKTNITPMTWGLTEINKLKPVSYSWKTDPINQGTQYGFIAQDVQSVMSDLVKPFKAQDGNEYLGLEKDGIYAAMVKAIQELSAQVTTLQSQVAALTPKA
jgi:hypothetical protein